GNVFVEKRLSLRVILQVIEGGTQHMQTLFPAGISGIILRHQRLCKIPALRVLASVKESIKHKTPHLSEPRRLREQARKLLRFLLRLACQPDDGGGTNQMKEMLFAGLRPRMKTFELFIRGTGAGEVPQLFLDHRHPSQLEHGSRLSLTTRLFQF